MIPTPVQILPQALLPCSPAPRVTATAGGRRHPRWIILHTRSRQEKAVSAQLTALGTRHFLPLVRRKRTYGRRRLAVDLPLFPSYVFLFGSPDHAYEAQRAGRLAQIIPVGDQQMLEWELSNIRLALAADVPLDPTPHLRAGVRVRVRTGPLRDLEGVIESRNRPDRLLLKVDILGRAVSLEIDGDLLEVVGE